MRAIHPLIWHLALCPAAALARAPLPPPPEFNAALDAGDYGIYPQREYVTSGGIKSPETNFPMCTPEYDDGKFIFFTPRGHSLPYNPGPMIMDARGELVWYQHYDNSFGGEAYNLRVQNFQGQDYLTFWLGDDRVRGHGSGFYYMLNQSYDVVRQFGAGHGLSADLHEFLLTDEGTALMSIYEITPGDVSMFREFHPEEHPEDENPNYVWDGIAQEIDVDTGKVLFEWRASDHINVTETYRPIYSMGNLFDPFDWFHINSIHKDQLGNYLISARYTHSIMYVDGRTRETIWQLGGKKNSFMDMSGGNATNFCWQHDARFLPLDTFPSVYTPPPAEEGVSRRLISIFDNAAEDQHYLYGLPYSRGLVVEVTFPTPGTTRAAQGPRKSGSSETFTILDEDGNVDYNMQKLLETNGTDPYYSVRVVASYENPQLVRSSSQGNMQIVPQGPGEDPKVLVGFGLSPVFTEFAANGTVLCDVHWGPKSSWDTAHSQSYRVYKFPWVGKPRSEPSVAISDKNDFIYVSWLGATEVYEWVLQGSRRETEDDSRWKDIGRVEKINFETVIDVARNLGGYRYLRIVAVDEHGARLPHGTSRIMDRGIMATHFPIVADKLPEEVKQMPPLKVFLIFACNVSGLIVLYELYRRYLSWRVGRPSAGAFRWRKGAAYKLLDAV